MLSVAPIAAFSGVILALCLVGFAGRKMLKQLLGRLWAQEIKEDGGSVTVPHSLFRSDPHQMVLLIP